MYVFIDIYSSHDFWFQTRISIGTFPLLSAETAAAAGTTLPAPVLRKLTLFAELTIRFFLTLPLLLRLLQHPVKVPLLVFAHWTPTELLQLSLPGGNLGEVWL